MTSSTCNYGVISAYLSGKALAESPHTVPSITQLTKRLTQLGGGLSEWTGRMDLVRDEVFTFETKNCELYKITDNIFG